MSSDSLWQAQAAVYARLAATPALTALLAGGAAGICDHMPENGSHPHLVLAGLQARPHETQEGGGHDIIITLRAFSRYAGMKELRGVMGAVSAALHGADFAVPGHRLVLCREIESETRPLPDGVTRERLQRFRLILEPVA